MKKCSHLYVYIVGKGNYEGDKAKCSKCRETISLYYTYKYYHLPNSNIIRKLIKIYHILFNWHQYAVISESSVMCYSEPYSAPMRLKLICKCGEKKEIEVWDIDTKIDLEKFKLEIRKCLFSKDKSD